MEIEFNDLYYQNTFNGIKGIIEKETITGIMGNDYSVLLYLLASNDVGSQKVLYNGEVLRTEKNRFITYIERNISFFTDSVYSEMLIYLYEDIDSEKKMEMVLSLVGLDYSFINKRITELSSGERKLLRVALALINNPKVLIIDDLFANVNLNIKKNLIHLFYDLKNKYHMTIIIGSDNSNTIYEICDKCLLINNKETLYADANTIFTIDNVKKYKIEMPDLVKFTNLARNKNIQLGYYQDIRDLIKDVYRHV